MRNYMGESKDPKEFDINLDNVRLYFHILLATYYNRLLCFIEDITSPL